MNLLKTLFGIIEAEAEAAVENALPSLTRPPEPSKVEQHIARFRRAVAQSENPAKLSELRANLAYWEAIAAAQALVQPE